MEKKAIETTLLPLSLEEGEVVYRDRNQTIRRVAARFEGFEKEYFVSDHGIRAAVAVVNGNDLLLVRQYRVLINGLSYELPGGRVDDGETPEAAAARECQEETGVACPLLRPLLEYLPSLDIWKNPTFVYYAETTGVVSPGKSDRHVWVPLDESVEMIFDGRITDSLSIVGILAYRAMKERTS